MVCLPDKESRDNDSNHWVERAFPDRHSTGKGSGKDPKVVLRRHPPHPFKTRCHKSPGMERTARVYDVFLRSNVGALVDTADSYGSRGRLRSKLVPPSSHYPSYVPQWWFLSQSCLLSPSQPHPPALFPLSSFFKQLMGQTDFYLYKETP